MSLFIYEISYGVRNTINPIGIRTKHTWASTSTFNSTSTSTSTHLKTHISHILLHFSKQYINTHCLLLLLLIIVIESTMSSLLYIYIY